MIRHKPFSQACENNQQPILEVLQRHLADVDHVLEIGSGTGQHAAFFAPHLAHLTWQTSDLAEHHEGIRLWVEDASVNNLMMPLELDVTTRPWPIDTTGAVFSANTAHIMSWSVVREFVAGAAGILKEDGVFCLYGPFNYAGKYTSDSNERFDQSLRLRGCGSGIRDFEAVDELAGAAGLCLVEDNAMPANNRLLVWRKPG
jgi:SAM-dependent methyltransferase